MASFKIFHNGQKQQVLRRSEGETFDSFKNRQVAFMNNTVHGWIAKKDEGDEGVNVSRLINQSDGAQRIAEILGL